MVSLGGCVTTSTTNIPLKQPAIPGIFHRIEKGQTLWRISKIYNVDLDELARINQLKETSTIEIGQLILIPKNRITELEPTEINNFGEEFIWPIKGRIISGFGQTSNNVNNKGLDIEANRTADVIAARSGKVVFCSDDFLNYGKTIILDHSDGFLTVYARNSQLFVKLGDIVKQGSIIAKVGHAGRNKNAYLHFQIRKNHIPQNPSFYLPR